MGETCDNSGHSYGDWTVITAADCTSTGLKSHVCSRCRNVEEVEIPATHDFEADWTVDKPATPTEDGIMSRHCTKCDAAVDQITFSYEEIGGDITDDTSSGEQSGDVPDNSDVSSDTSVESSSDQQDFETVSTDSSASSESTDNKPVIDNTEGAKVPLSVVENLKDYQENIKPNQENESSDVMQSDSSDEEISSADASDTQNDDTQTPTQNSSSFLQTHTDIVIAVIGILLLCGIIALVIILIVRNKNQRKNN